MNKYVVLFFVFGSIALAILSVIFIQYGYVFATLAYAYLGVAFILKDDRK